MKKSILNIISLMCCLTIMLTATSCGNNAKKEEIVVDGIIPLISESELILRSDLIIEGTVSEIMDSKWSNPNNEKGENFRNILQTDITGMRQGKYDLSESENSRLSNTINTYISSMEVDNERDTEVIDELKDKIEKEHNMHPNYSDEQKQKQIEIDNENKKLFGE